MKANTPKMKIYTSNKSYITYIEKYAKLPTKSKIDLDKRIKKHLKSLKEFENKQLNLKKDVNQYITK